jgi:hypothetical protein
MRQALCFLVISLLAPAWAQNKPSNPVFIPIDVPGATSTSIYGINDLGMFVGTYTDASGAQHGFFGHL